MSTVVKVDLETKIKAWRLVDQRQTFPCPYTCRYWTHDGKVCPRFGPWYECLFELEEMKLMDKYIKDVRRMFYREYNRMNKAKAAKVAAEAAEAVRQN